MNILAFTTQNSGVGYHRIMLPLHYMKKQNLIKGHVRLGDTLNDKTFEGHDFDIVIVNRYIVNTPLSDLLKYKEKYGFKLIIDIDDYWHLYPGHIIYDNYPTKEIIDHIKAADFVTVTNQILYNLVTTLGQKNVEIVPNALPFDEDQFTDIRVPSDRINFNYVAGSSHEYDLKTIRNAIKRAQSDSEFKAKATLTLSGFQDHPVYHRMATYMKGGHPYNFYIRKALDVHNYMNLYNDTDVAIAPLLNNTFNLCKSNLKALEAAAKRIPIIVSDIGTYEDCPYAIKATDQHDWYKEFKFLIQDPVYRKEIGEDNAIYCREHFNIYKINKIREQIYTQWADIKQ